MPSLKNSRLTAGFVLLTLLVAGTVFACDIFMPLGRAVPVLYVGLILLSRTSRWPPYALILGLLASLLTIVGYFMSPGDPVEAALTDRAIALAMIWVTTFLCFRHTQVAAELAEAKRRLEREVEAIEIEVAEATTALEVEQEGHKQKQAELQETEQRYEAVFDQTFQIIAIVGRDGRVERTNETMRSLGNLTAAELKGRPIWDVALWTGHAASQEALRSAVAAAARGDFYRDEMSFDKADGEEMIVDFSMKPIRNQSGAVEYFIFEARDVTEHRRMQEIASQKQRLEIIGTLTSGIAHDFNNLLTVIGGNLELAALRIKDNEAAQRRIELALEAVFQGKSLTQQMLAIARRQELTPTNVDLRQLVGTVTNLLEHTLPDIITLKTELSEDLWLCWTDPAQLQSAILNLVVNARDAMPNGGSVVVRCHNVSLAAEPEASRAQVEAGDYLQIDVVDQGHGIPPEILDRVTEPFFTTKETGKGSGLGLSMVHGFVQQSGGNLQISSTPGQGTTISLFLPRASSAATEAEGDRAIAHRNGQILVLEDDDNVREVIASMLTDIGHSVAQAGDGSEALEQLRVNGPFDLVIADVTFPGEVDVRDVVRFGRSLNSRLKILYSSADRRKAETLVEEDTQGAQFITKPYRYAELSSKVATLLADARTAEPEGG